MFETILPATMALTLPSFMVAIGAALLLSLALAFAYILMNRLRGYEQSFVLTLAVIPAVIALVVMLVGNSAAKALSLGGALALIRFRTVLSEPYDVAYLFFAVAVGLACGLGYIGYAVLFAVLIVLLMALLHITHFAAPAAQDVTLKITLAESMDFEHLFDAVFNQYASSWTLRKVRSADFGALYELQYRLHLKNGSSQKELLDAVRTLNGNLPVSLSLLRNIAEE